MSSSRVPPARVEVSPAVSYQNGPGVLVKAISSNELLRHEVMSGEDASVRPLSSFQEAFVENNSSALAEERTKQVVKRNAAKARGAWVMGNETNTVRP